VRRWATRLEHNSGYSRSGSRSLRPWGEVRGFCWPEFLLARAWTGMCCPSARRSCWTSRAFSTRRWLPHGGLRRKTAPCRLPSFAGRRGASSCWRRTGLGRCRCRLARLSRRGRFGRPPGAGRLRHLAGLIAHRDYPMIGLDNNRAERAIREPVVTRKNADCACRKLCHQAIFVDHADGAVAP